MMQFFKKLFQPSAIKKTKKSNPENAKLLALLNAYCKDNKYDNYKKVVAELTEGNAYLVLPSYKHHSEEFKNWARVKEGHTIDLGIYFVDELKAIAAFSSKESLFEWKKKVKNEVISYVALPSKVIIEICEKNGVDRIVVDSNLSTMVVLQKNK